MFPMNEYPYFETNSQYPIVVYTKDPCPYCVLVKRLLQNLNYPYEERDLTVSQDEMDKIKQETGWRTFPIVIVHNKVIGGYMDTKALHDQALLGPMVYENNPK